MFPQRATAGLRRTAAELTDGNHDNGSSGNNNPVDNSPTPTQPADPVTMEISSPPQLTDLERDNLVSCLSQEVEELYYPNIRGVQQSISGKQEGIEAAEGEHGKRDEDECDYLVFEIAEQKEGEEGGESEGEQDTERGGEEGVEGGRGETEGENEGRVGTAIEERSEKVEGEDGTRGETEGEDKGRRETEGTDKGRRETEGEEGGRGEIEGEDEGREKIGEKDGGSRETLGEDGRKGDEKEEDGWREEMVGEMTDDAMSDLFFISDSPTCPLSLEPCVVTSDPSEQPAAAMLLEAWGHDLCNRDDLSDGHLSDCLQAELAIVYSDSDAGEDQWAALAQCEFTSQQEASDGIQDGICDRESKEEERRGEDEEDRREEEDEAELAEIGTEEQREEEVEQQEKRNGGGDDDEEQIRSRRDLFLRSPSVSSTASSSDPDRRVRLSPLLIKH